jgi:uncharacterized protein involved in type VI secretion and phage assembly
MNQYFGKYRGKVTNNLDPEQMGRIQVSCPAVFGTGQLNWAMPSVPYAGIQCGFYAIPAIQANVWIEFEGGDIEKPIWSGCFWGTGEAPAVALATPTSVPHIVMQNTGQSMLQVSDLPGPTGGIILKTKSGEMIMINETGITITNGKGAIITLTAKITDINGGALTIT